MGYLDNLTALSSQITSTQVGRGYPVRESEFNPEEFVVTESTSNPFGGQYTGVNEKLGVGSEISFAKQAGVDRSGRTLGFF